jgi:hypothetical protein
MNKNSFSARIVFCHPHSPVDGSKDDEHEGDPPLPNEYADLKDCAVSAIILCVVLSESIHLGLLIPEIST